MTAERIDFLAPLPEDPARALLMEMLVLAPYEAPEKKAKKKATGTRGGLRPKGTSDVASEDTETHSTAEDDEEEEEEEVRNFPLPEGGKKRVASIDLEAEASKEGKASFVDSSAWDVDSSPERRPRDKPLAES